MARPAHLFADDLLHALIDPRFLAFVAEDSARVPLATILAACDVAACIGMACIVATYVFMACIVMACIGIACVVTEYIVMASICTAKKDMA